MSNLTQIDMAQLNAENTGKEAAQPAGATTNGRQANGARVNGSNGNGSRYGAPNVHAVVMQAAELAAERGMSLRAEALSTKPDALLQKEPWNRLPAELQEMVRQVDIMATLGKIEPQMAAVDGEIERLITTPVKLIADVAAHTLGAGGKRLRPALVILAAQLCGDSAETADIRAVTCAAAVELLHTTSLIHDDVVDSAATRRGKPAANLVWGNQTSILVGDYLVAQVFVTVSERGFHNLLAPMAHATSQLCAGELLETQTRGLLSMKEEQYCDIIAMKTAALTECACRLGAMVMNAGDEQADRLARYGREIGMAFQIVDDVFDIVASEGRVGKPVGNDIREGDITLPMLRAMEVCSESEREELRAIIGKDGISAEEVQRALQIIRESDAVSHSLAAAARYIASAKAQIADFPASTARDMLNDVADYVLSRDR